MHTHNHNKGHTVWSSDVRVMKRTNRSHPDAMDTTDCFIPVSAFFAIPISSLNSARVPAKNNSTNLCAYNIINTFKVERNLSHLLVPQ